VFVAAFVTRPYLSVREKRVKSYTRAQKNNLQHRSMISIFFENQHRMTRKTSPLPLFRQIVKAL
jgi:hypothetical protein